MVVLECCDIALPLHNWSLLRFGDREVLQVAPFPTEYPKNLPPSLACRIPGQLLPEGKGAFFPYIKVQEALGSLCRASQARIS